MIVQVVSKFVTQEKRKSTTTRIVHDGMHVNESETPDFNLKALGTLEKVPNALLIVKFTFKLL